METTLATRPEMANQNVITDMAVTDRLDTASYLSVFTSANDAPSQDLGFEAQLLKSGRELGASLFMFKWLKPVLVLGRGQSLAGIDEQFCRAADIPILWRHSGGTAVLHQKSLNIALVLDARHTWTRRIDSLYLHFVNGVTQALNGMGIPVTVPHFSSSARQMATDICFEADFGETILLDGRKVFGCAQRRLQTAVLVHGSLLLGLDIAQQSRVFKVPEHRIARTMTHIPGDVDESALMNAIAGSFSSRLELVPNQKGDYHGR